MSRASSYLTIILLLASFACTSRQERAREEIRQGEAALFASDLNKAKEHFDKAIDLDPGNAEAWLRRASVYSNLQGYDLALADLDKAIDLDPDMADAWYNRATIKTILGNDLEACDDYKEAYRLGKKNMYDKVKHCPDPPERRE